MNPFIPKEKKYAQIRQWDLWGPLLLNIILAFTLTLNTKEKGQMTALIFIIFWLGGSIIYLNNYFLEVKTSIFQIYCLLGYCLSIQTGFYALFSPKGHLCMTPLTV